MSRVMIVTVQQGLAWIPQSQLLTGYFSQCELINKNMSVIYLIFSFLNMYQTIKMINQTKNRSYVCVVAQNLRNVNNFFIPVSYQDLK